LSTNAGNPEGIFSEKAKKIAEKIESARKGFARGGNEHCTIPNIFSPSPTAQQFELPEYLGFDRIPALRFILAAVRHQPA
jgi:hypothetical protein